MYLDINLNQYLRNSNVHLFTENYRLLKSIHPHVSLKYKQILEKCLVRRKTLSKIIDINDSVYNKKININYIKEMNNVDKNLTY